MGCLGGGDNYSDSGGEQDANNGRTELRILIDCEERLISVPLHIGSWSVKEAVERYMKDANLQGSLAGYGLLEPGQEDIDSMAHDIMPFVSIILYICGNEPDLSNLEEPNTHPQRPQPKKTKKGWRLFLPRKSKHGQWGRRLVSSCGRLLMNLPTLIVR